MGRWCRDQDFMFNEWHSQWIIWKIAQIFSYVMRWQMPKAWLMHQLFDINWEIELKRNFNLILMLRLGVVPSIYMCRQLKLMWLLQTPHLHSLDYICLSNELLLLGKFIGITWTHGFFGEQSSNKTSFFAVMGSLLP